jgi:hypothetical protein
VTHLCVSSAFAQQGLPDDSPFMPSADALHPYFMDHVEGEE